MMHPDRFAGLPASDQRSAHDEYVQLEAARDLLVASARQRYPPDHDTSPGTGSSPTKGTVIERELLLSPKFARQGGVRPVVAGDGRLVPMRIPPGLANGARLRIAGRGGVGVPPGDLFITIRIAQPEKPPDAEARRPAGTGRPNQPPDPETESEPRGSRRRSRGGHSRPAFYMLTALGLIAVVGIAITVALVSATPSAERLRWTPLEFSVSTPLDETRASVCSGETADCRAMYVTSTADCDLARVTIWYGDDPTNIATQEEQLQVSILRAGVPRLIVATNETPLPAFASVVDLECQI